MVVESAVVAEPAVVVEPAPDIDIASAVAAGIDPVVGESAFGAGRLGPEIPGPEPEAEEAEVEDPAGRAGER